MAHDHVHRAEESNLKRVMIALVLTGTFMVVEVIGGIISGSLALLADAGHMLTDTMALALAAAAFHVSKRPAGGSLTYGYQRFQILAAFVNGLSLLLVVGWIFYEAVRRFITPRDILGETMLTVAAAGLVINVISFAVLHSGDQENLNIRGAALHVAGDLLGSVAAIVAAVVIIYTGWTLIDPILSVAVAFLILRSAWVLVKRSAHVLLEGAPDWLDVTDLQRRIVANISGVYGIHHVHVWGLTPQRLMLTMHLQLDDEARSQSAVVREVKAFLRDEYGIDHSTIEVELDELRRSPGCAALGRCRTSMCSAAQGYPALVVGRNNPDVGEGAISLRVVEAVSDHPLISDIKAEVVCLHFDLGAFCLADERAGLDRCRPMRLEHANQVLERVARVDDILDDEHVLALDIAAHVHDQAYRAGRRAPAAVAGDRDELDGARNAQAARKVGQEDK